MFQAIPLIFTDTKGFNMSESGLVFTGVGIGTSLGSVLYVWTCRSYSGLAAKWKGFPPPENRLFAAMIGSPILTIGCFWLGWSGQYTAVPWYVPAISTIFVGTGIASIFMSFLVSSGRAPVLVKLTPLPRAGVPCGYIPNVQCLCPRC